MTVIHEVDHLTPAEMARQSGLSLDTLRYYETQGLLGPIERLSNGHRRYSPTDASLVEMVRRLRDTGMPIRDVREFARLFREDDPSTNAARAELLDAHRNAVMASLAETCSALEVIERKRNRYLQCVVGSEQANREVDESTTREESAQCSK